MDQLGSGLAMAGLSTSFILSINFREHSTNNYSSYEQ